MLLSFKAKNFLSFGDNMEFSMRQNSNITRFSERVHHVNNEKVMKIRSIYGANGSGKTNLLKAIKFLISCVQKSKIDLDSYKIIKNRVDSSLINNIIKLEIEFIPFFDNDIIFKYSLEYNDVRVLNEKLIEVDTKNKTEYVLIKAFDQELNKYIFKENGKQVKNEKISSRDTSKELNEIIYEEDKDDLIFQNGPFKNNIICLVFKMSLQLSYFHEETTKSQSLDSLRLIFRENKNFNQFKELICSIDTGISDVKIEDSTLKQYYGKRDEYLINEIKTKLDDNDSKEFVEYDEDLNEYLFFYKKNKGTYHVKYFNFYHNNDQGVAVEFSREMESEGTKRVLDLYPKLLSAIYSQNIWFIDEIEKSIHPNLLHQFMSILLKFPNMRGQIIFTTHETSLLDLNIFRQDEICFVEKNKKGNSEFYLLSDFDNIRNDLDIKKAYINGRFGAIPFLEDLKTVN